MHWNIYAALGGDELTHQGSLIKPNWSIKVSENYDITGLGNGLSSVQRQAIIWTNSVL